MTDTPNGQVESMNEKPGPEGQWMVQRVENGKYTEEMATKIHVYELWYIGLYRGCM